MAVLKPQPHHRSCIINVPHASMHALPWAAQVVYDGCTVTCAWRVIRPTLCGSWQCPDMCDHTAALLTEQAKVCDRDQPAAHGIAAGCNSFRLSIEWSRLYPQRGELDQSAVQRYHQIFDALDRRACLSCARDGADILPCAGVAEAARGSVSRSGPAAHPSTG